MIIGFSEEDRKDDQYWQANDRKVLKRINSLTADITSNPFDSNGLGKPERLKEISVVFFLEESPLSTSSFQHQGPSIPTLQEGQTA